MLAVGHIASGYLLGKIASKEIPNPYAASLVGFTTSFAAHYILDFIPHGHITKKPQYTNFTLSTLLILLEVFGGGLFFLFATYINFGLSSQSLIILISIFGALLPDVISGLEETFLKDKTKKGFFKLEYLLHHWSHWHGDKEKTLLISWRDIWQIAFVLIAIFWP